MVGGSFGYGSVILISLVWSSRAAAVEVANSVAIPIVKPAERRTVRIDDLANLRLVDSLSVSPDGTKYVVFLRQADTRANRYRAAWYVGDVSTKSLVFVGDGGELSPSLYDSGQEGDDIRGGVAKWAPNGRTIAYLRGQNGERQVWLSDITGQSQRQLTHSASDVVDFAWVEDGGSIIFTVGQSRAEIAAWSAEREKKGYAYNEDLDTISDLLQRSVHPPRRPSEHYSVRLSDGSEKPATPQEKAAFEKDRAALSLRSHTMAPQADPSTRIANARGDRAWTESLDSSAISIKVSLRTSKTVECGLEACRGHISAINWSQDGKELRFLRSEGFNRSVTGFYAWSPSSNSMKTIRRIPDENLQLCQMAAHDKYICVKDGASTPPRIVSIERSGRSELLVDINPEFSNIRLGKVKRLEWNVPTYSWEDTPPLKGLYRNRAYGYIIFPPDFNPKKKYPVFIQPYVARGFAHPIWAEHPLQSYAASGMIVVSLSFPEEDDSFFSRLGVTAAMRLTYSENTEFPHLTKLAGSTFKGLDTAASTAPLDLTKVGIGGVSHGTFVPLFALQQLDRLSAVSISSPYWNELQYYWPTRRLSHVSGWLPKPSPKSRRFWEGLDLAEHVDTVEAPILMNLADRETYSLLKLIKNLDDASKPYDTYVFRGEGHIKYQPAHLYSIMTRNLDWFRYWLQDVKDPDPAKREQYARWDRLRRLQCKNPRALRKVCGLEAQPRP